MSSVKAYAVGKGKPPVHTRFKKGQSGNPSGKPGPKKAMKAQLREALEKALESQPHEIEIGQAETAAGEIVRKLVNSAIAGWDTGSRRLLFRLIDTLEPETRRCAPPEEATVAPPPDDNETLTVSLPQGKTQGSFQKPADAPEETQTPPEEPSISRADAGNTTGNPARAAEAPPPYVRDKRPTIIIAGEIVQEGD